VPVLVGAQRLLEARAFLAGLCVPCFDESGGFEHPVGARGANGDDIAVEHHEGETAVAFKRELVVEVDDGAAFPGLEPVVAGDEAVVLVGFAVAFAPVVILGAADAQPVNEPQGPKAAALAAPFFDEVDHLVSDVVRGPGIGQTSPRLFFKRTCSSMSSARASLRIVNLLSRAASLRSVFPTPREGDRPLSKAAVPFSKKVFCHW